LPAYLDRKTQTGHARSSINHTTQRLIPEDQVNTYLGCCLLAYDAV
jgi:hypothetical protein